MALLEPQWLPLLIHRLAQRARPICDGGIERASAQRELLQSASFRRRLAVLLRVHDGWCRGDDGRGCPPSMSVLSTNTPVGYIRTLTVHRHGGDGRGLVAGSVFLGLGGQLRVGGMAEAHQAEAARVGRGLLYRRSGRGFVIMAGGRPRNVGRSWAAAILGHGHTTLLKDVARAVGLRIFVAALEKVGWVEGAAPFEVPFAAARPERPYRHCGWRGLAAHLCGEDFTVRCMAQRRKRVPPTWRCQDGVGCGTPVRLKEC